MIMLVFSMSRKLFESSTAIPVSGEFRALSRTPGQRAYE